MAKQLPIFAVNRYEVARAHQVQHQLLLFLAGVPGNVQQAAAVVVIDQRLAAVHMIEHAENRFFVAGNDARRQDHGVLRIHAEQPVIIHGDPR